MLAFTTTPATFLTTQEGRQHCSSAMALLARDRSLSPASRTSLLSHRSLLSCLRFLHWIRRLSVVGPPAAMLSPQSQDLLDLAPVYDPSPPKTIPLQVSVSQQPVNVLDVVSQQIRHLPGGQSLRHGPPSCFQWQHYTTKKRGVKFGDCTTREGILGGVVVEGELRRKDHPHEHPVRSLSFISCWLQWLRAAGIELLAAPSPGPGAELFLFAETRPWTARR